MEGKTVFLAYAREDREWADKTRQKLLDNGIELFSDDKLEVGERWELVIADQLRSAAAIVVLMSAAASRSGWVTRELEYAEATQKPVLPLLVRDQPLPELSKIQYLDLRGRDSVPEELVTRLREVLGEVPAESQSDADRILKILDNRSLGPVLDRVQSKLVLILGNFSGENLDRLLRLQAELQRRELHGVIFDFERPPASDYGETIRLLAGLAGFVIADMSDPRSVVMELQLIVPNLAVPVVPVMAATARPVALFSALLGKYDWVLPPVSYRKLDDLVVRIDDEIVAPAQAKREELRNRKASAARVRVGEP